MSCLLQNISEATAARSGNEGRGEEQENDWWKREEMRGAGGLCTVRRVDKETMMRRWAPQEL